MVRKSDFLMEVSGNRNLFHTILLNGFLASIECEEFTNASYFKRVIKEHFYNENETYFRIVYLWAEGLLDSKQGRVKEGQKKMEDAVRIFEMLGCNKSVEYYRKTTDCWISANQENDLKFEAIELLGSLVSLEKFYRFFLLILFVAYIQKFFL